MLHLMRPLTLINIRHSWGMHRARVLSLLQAILFSNSGTRQNLKVMTMFPCEESNGDST